jgi:hypothetical protein
VNCPADANTNKHVTGKITIAYAAKSTSLNDKERENRMEVDDF